MFCKIFFNPFSFSLLVAAQVLLNGLPAQADLFPPPTKSKAKQKVIKTASDPISLRKIRRVGIGAAAAGPLGLGGILLEMNFFADSSVGLGLGGGPGYQSFVAQSKHLVGDSGITPYFLGGYARWTKIGNQGPIEKSTPGYLSDRLLTEQQKANGTFAKNLIYPGFGLSYLMLDGEFAGTSIYAEVLALIDIEEFLIVPTGGLGVVYFF